MEGILLRSRAREIAEGEKITKCICGLKKRNYFSKQMIKPTLKNGAGNTWHYGRYQGVKIIFRKIIHSQTFRRLWNIRVKRVTRLTRLEVSSFLWMQWLCECDFGVVTSSFGGSSASLHLSGCCHFHFCFLQGFVYWTISISHCAHNAPVCNTCS